MKEEYFHASDGKQVKIIKDDLDEDNAALDELMGPYREIKRFDPKTGEPFGLSPQKLL